MVFFISQEFPDKHLLPRLLVRFPLRFACLSNDNPQGPKPYSLDVFHISILHTHWLVKPLYSFCQDSLEMSPTLAH